MPVASPRIAIVDDDPSVLKALARLLSTRALIATTFQSGKKFLASLEDEVPDCLILDLQMPEMTGLELHQDLGRRGVRIPTIIITARNEAEMCEQCTSAGAIAFLPKPINDASLFAAIELAGQLGRAQ
ncbi:MAG: response regulator [Xanthobacteraceae bacterium]